jgi:CheY-like chemotaxis protein
MASMARPKLPGISVLVVEDHEDMRYLLQHWLTSAGAQVTVASNGEEALSLLRSTPPDVILCDLHMPRMDGCEFVRRMEEMVGANHAPVIAVTGSASERALFETLAAGFFGHLVKPVTSEAVTAQIRRALSLA